MSGLYHFYLKGIGLADTRIDSIREAVDSLHAAVGYLDLENRRKLREACPWIFDTVQQYADMESGLNRYDD